MYRKTDQILSSFGGPLVPPLVICDSREIIESVMVCCHRAASFYAKSGKYVGQNVFMVEEGLGEWYLQAIRNGGGGYR
jgi:hypothetical protein